MSKRALCNDGNQKPVQAGTPANNQKENIDRLVEMAAEQFGTLLWNHWLFKKC